MQRFLINRNDLELDDSILESEGLTIGRLPGNDLVLNHPSVSRTQAGIKGVEGRFWIFNLSKRNSTLLNGQAVYQLPLVDGDVIQVGPYALLVNYLEICFSCAEPLLQQEEVSEGCPRCRAEHNPEFRFCTECGYDYEKRVTGRQICVRCGSFEPTGMLFCTQCGARLRQGALTPASAVCKKCGQKQPEEGERKYVLSISVQLQVTTRTLAPTDQGAQTIVAGRPITDVRSRTGGDISGSAILTGFLPPENEQALKIFWDKRKREAGKLAPKIPLAPRTGEQVGKAQFGWRPSSDLRRLRNLSFLTRLVFLSGGLATVLLLYYPEGFSPGDVSAPHASFSASARKIAVRANANSCTGCHSLQTMKQNCVECHNTAAFTPSVSQAHERAGISCTGCHTEHQGFASRPGLVTSATCVGCHNAQYEFNGKSLGIPHGGTVGYPVKADEWIWPGIPEDRWRQIGLPGEAADYSIGGQFHLAHFSLYSKKGVSRITTRCTDCHATANRSDPLFFTAPVAACASCHTTNYNLANLEAVGPNCATCHEQHGSYKELIATPRKFPSPGGTTLSSPELLALVRVENIPYEGQGGAESVREQRAASKYRSSIGGMPLSRWALAGASLPLVFLALVVTETIRRRSRIQYVPAREPREWTIEAPLEKRSIDLQRLQREGPKYPYPVVDPLLCIGCHACVEACPHDVLAMVNGIATPVAADQCMEDTGCTIECPTQPKACVVLNTEKRIPEPKVPKRDERFRTDVAGVYIIGEVAGVPLIKMAINEGAKAIDCVQADLQADGRNALAEYDVAIIGMGPGGLSAVAVAAERGLKYLALEQEKVVSTIQNYPAGKYVFYKPDGVSAIGPVPLPGAGALKEDLVQSWQELIQERDLIIHEDETCKDVRPEGGCFRIQTLRGQTQSIKTYTSRKIVLALGNRGAPMKLGVPGEDIEFHVPGFRPGQSKVQTPDRCPQCALPFGNEQQLTMALKGNSIAFHCNRCNYKVQEFPKEDYQEAKVKYRLSNPDDYSGKKCIVVGGGNSAIEAAVDLCGLKRQGRDIQFIRNNEVTLIVRSDFKADLKLGNKMNIYDCIDAGKVKVYFGAAIKEIRESEVVLFEVKSNKLIATPANDYVFALIGGEKPTRFLKNIGITISGA